MHFDYRLIKERRKSLRLYVENGEVIVKAPKIISKRYIDDFVSKYREWIEKELEKYQNEKRDFTEGERFLYFGEEFSLLFKPLKKDFIFENGFFVNCDLKERTKKLLIDFYKSEAKKYISKRVIELAKDYGLSFNKIKINSAKRRWASCSSKGNLNFSYRLIMAPKSVIDYVIIHELSHLTHMNHSKDFWALVQQRCPNYKAYEKWLKSNCSKTIF